MKVIAPVLAIVVGIAAAILVYWLVTGRQPVQVEAPSAPAAAPQSPAPAISGNYADDWQARCGPLTPADVQANCTAQLDKAYGRTADAPVPAK